MIQLTPHEEIVAEQVLGLFPNISPALAAFRFYSELRPQFKDASIRIDAFLNIIGSSGVHKTDIASLILCPSDNEHLEFLELRKGQLTKAVAVNTITLVDDFCCGSTEDIKKQLANLNLVARATNKASHGALAMTCESVAPKADSFSLRDRMLPLYLPTLEGDALENFLDGLSTLQQEKGTWEKIILKFRDAISENSDMVKEKLHEAFRSRILSGFRIRRNVNALIASMEVFCMLFPLEYSSMYLHQLRQTLDSIATNQERRLSTLKRLSQKNDLVFEVALMVDNLSGFQVYTDFPKPGERIQPVSKNGHVYFRPWQFWKILNEHLDFCPTKRQLLSELVEAGFLEKEKSPGFTSKRGPDKYYVLNRAAMQQYLEEELPNYRGLVPERSGFYVY